MRNQGGFTLILAVIFIMVIAVMGNLIAYLFANSAALSTAQENGLSVFYNAESGLEIGTRLLTIPTLTGTTSRSSCASITGTAAITNATMGTGKFTVTTVNSSPIYAVTTLSTAATSSDTVINLTSSSGFAASGRVMIDDESIDYAAVSGNTLIGATRGVAGSTAVSHVINAGVGQYECTIDSEAGIPSVTAPNYKRELQEGIQLQDGWLAGNVASGHNMVFGRWNYATEKAWNLNEITLTVDVNLTSVFALSYADAWAVGSAQSSNLTFYHWNGSAWSRVLPAASINAAMNGVFCIASNDCWAVGAANASNPIIERWNGTSWARVLPSLSVNTALNSIFCNNTSDCWAVGATNSGNPLIERWNGTSWAQVLPTVSVNTALQNVYCNNTSDCWAVGATNSGNPLIERWNGTSWARVLPAVSVNKTLYSVYCNSTTDCWAVGQNNTVLLILHWDGTSWTTTSPSVSNANDLHAVACVDTNDCWAVGANSTTVHWDGSAWTVVAAPGGFPSVQLNSVSLIGPSQQPNSSWQQIFH